jgi:threonine synthase
MTESAKEIGAAEGVFSSPEGAACHAALKNLLNSGWIKTDETIVLFNTGSGLKYLDMS